MALAWAGWLVWITHFLSTFLLFFKRVNYTNHLYGHHIMDEGNACSYMDPVGAWTLSRRTGFSGNLAKNVQIIDITIHHSKGGWRCDKKCRKVTRFLVSWWVDISIFCGCNFKKNIFYWNWFDIYIYLIKIMVEIKIKIKNILIYLIKNNF